MPNALRLGLVALLALSCRRKVEPNTAPTGVIDAPIPGAAFDLGEPVNFTGTVSDAEDALDTLAVQWSSDVDGPLSEDGADATGLVSFTSANLSEGEHVISLRVTDSGALEVTDSVAISVVASDGAPTLTIVAPDEDASIPEGESFLFEATVSDPEDAPEDLIVDLESDLEGSVCTPSVTTTGDASCEATLDAGHHLLTFSVLDTDGNMVSATVYFDVLGPLQIDDDGDGLSEEDGDCDDKNGDVSPEATELIADEIDSDCDGRETCYLDTDGDGIGATVTTTSADVDCADFSESTASDDCDDKKAGVNPAADEVAGDGIDQNCDGSDGCFEDLDGDGFGSLNAQPSADTDCDDVGESAVSSDCDDQDAAIFEGAVEGAGDLVDQDCDGRELCFVDQDKDTFRTSATALGTDATCAAADGEAVATAALDCDDADGAISPSATELPGDGVEQNCDGLELCYLDVDKDGFRTTVTALGTDAVCQTSSGEAGASALLDCDDLNAMVNPTATELAGDGADQDCNGGETCFVDADGDGARTTATVASPDPLCDGSKGEALSVAALDCVDSDPFVAPGLFEVLADGVDQDCDGAELCYVDGDKDGTRSGGQVISPNATCDKADGEALTSALVDCADSDAAVYPGAGELPGDGADQDCDGTEVCYVDGDKDGARTSATLASSDVQCTKAAGEALGTALIDCDDTKSTIYPGATEVAGDKIDQSCDGGELCYVDADDDDYGSTTVASVDLSCNGPGEGHKAGECDDADKLVYPGATEIVGDDRDQSCDGAEVCYVDTDDDDYGTSSTLVSSDKDCNDLNEGHKVGDCDDGNKAINPAAPEVWYNGVDDRCDAGDDFDQDGDGKATVASGGTDLNDLDPGCSDKCNIGHYPSASAAASAGLTDYWLFNGNANEYPGFRNINLNVFQATFINSTSPFTGVPAPSRPAVIDFDGVNDYANSPNRQLTGSTYTVSIWLYMDAANPSGRSYPLDGHSAGGNYYLLIDSHDRVHLGTCASEWGMAEGTSVLGQWVHHVWRANGSTMVYTRNGTASMNLTQSGGGNCTPNDNPLVLGTFGGVIGSSGQYFFNGKIAEYAVWNGTRLSDAQVDAIYNSRRPLIYAP